jgi:hypothetical protein
MVLESGASRTSSDGDDWVASARCLADRAQDIGLLTDEVCQPNAFYGHAQVLKRAAAWTEPLPAVVPHGVSFVPGEIWRVESRAPLSAVLCYPPYLQSAYERVTKKIVVPGGAPILYVLDQIPEPTERRGTIFFPTHSTHHITVDGAWEGLAAKLAAIGGPLAPVTVCVYWRDVQLGRHLPFIDRGLDVVCAGHIYDEHFLYRLVSLLRMHTYAATSGLGSQVVFAAAAGCVLTALPGLGQPARSEVGAVASNEANVDLTGHVLPVAAAKKVLDVLLPAEPGGGDPAMQRAFAEELLGRDRQLHGEDLFAEFARLRRVDRWGTVTRDASDRVRIVPPMAWRRRTTRIRRAVRTATRNLSHVSEAEDV